MLGQETKGFTLSSYDKLTNKIIDGLLNHKFDEVLNNLLKQITLPTNAQYARHGLSFFRVSFFLFLLQFGSLNLSVIIRFLFKVSYVYFIRVFSIIIIIFFYLQISSWLWNVLDGKVTKAYLICRS